ncbi:MAG: hypothetical protein ACRESY_06745 [Steroidobacteraceae bacterium]
MHWRLIMAAAFLIGLGASSRAHAVNVTTYGSGLKPCASYLDAHDQQTSDEIAYLDWLSGYFSGVNVTSSRTNNLLGNTNLKSAVIWVARYCRAHPTEPFSVASFALLMGASASTATQAAQPIAYGAGFKTCDNYLDARAQGNGDDMVFVDWLGGYLSGVNAISQRTTNVLGTADLTSAIFWLDHYCRDNSPVRFSAAADARIAAAVTSVAEATPPSKR